MSYNNQKSKEQQEQDELDDLLFGSSTPRIIQTPPKQQQQQQQRTTQNDDDDLAFLLGESPSQLKQKQQQQQSSSSSSAGRPQLPFPATSSSSTNNNNNNHNNNYNNNSYVAPSSTSNGNTPPPRSPTTTRSAPVVTILGEEPAISSSSSASGSSSEKFQKDYRSSDDSKTTKAKKSDDEIKKEKKEKEESEQTNMPGSFKEELFWTIVYAIAPFTLVIVIFSLGYSGTIPGGTCEKDFEGTCMPMVTSGGGVGTAAIFSQADVQHNLGCPDASQACVSATISLDKLYSDDRYMRCVGYSGTLPPMENMSTTANTSSEMAMNKTMTGKIWIVPSIQDSFSPNINITRAVECCPFLAGGAAGPSVSQLIAKAFFGASLDIALNALTAIPIVARIIDWMILPLRYLSGKITALLITRQVKKKAQETVKLVRKNNSSSNLDEAAFSRKNSFTNLDDTALLAIRPNPSSTTTSPGVSGGRGGGVGGGAGGDPRSSSISSWDDCAEDNAAAQVSDMDAEFATQDISHILAHYTEEAEKKNEQMLKDLELNSWVDEVCFPSTLMIMKSVSFALFGAFLSFYEITKPIYAQDSHWQKYNAYSANVINGAVFGAWLDIGVQFFAFYTVKDKIFRKSMKIAPLAPTIGMSLYVKFMFAPDKEHPVYKFFKYCRAVKIGTMICWVCYIAPYVTHICMSFFYYLPQITVYYMTMVNGGGLICCLIVKVFDTYGDKWKDDLDKQLKLKERKDNLEKQQQQQKNNNNKSSSSSSNSNNKNESLKVEVTTTTSSSNDNNELNIDPTIENKSLFWPQVRTFFGRYLLMVMYSILVNYVYSLLCNWAVLLYSNYDRYGGASNYLLVVWDELAIRQMSCQILMMREAFAIGDRFVSADTVLGYI